MPTPEFVKALREKVGHDPLFLSGVTMVVLNDAAEVLLVRRSDDGRWALVTGIIDPGEQPAVAGVREVAEETGVTCVVERLTSVWTQPPTAYANGDRCQFLDITFRARYVAGEARVNDDESSDVRWFALDHRPDLGDVAELTLSHALAHRDAPWYEGADG